MRFDAPITELEEGSYFGAFDRPKHALAAFAGAIGIGDLMKYTVRGIFTVVDPKKGTSTTYKDGDVLSPTGAQLKTYPEKFVPYFNEVVADEEAAETKQKKQGGTRKSPPTVPTVGQDIGDVLESDTETSI